MSKKLLLILLAGTSLAGSLHAQTVINITGATAFRSAATAAIQAAFAANGNYSVSFTDTDDAGSATTRNNGVYQVWRGTIGSGANQIVDCVIRTSWNGSVEGVRALLQPGVSNNAAYLDDGTYAPVPTGVGLPLTTVSFALAVLETAPADLAFSDVTVASTPIPGTASGGPVGIIAFTMIANQTWRLDDGAAGSTGSATAGITSISAQQWRAIAGQGKLPLGWFKGNTTDTTPVYLTGRNDGSGTRTTYLAETGYGISKPVVQYVVHDRTTATITKLLKTAAGGGFNFQNVATPTNASTVWAQDIDGNGGYSTGGDIRVDLAKTSASAEVWEFFDADESGGYDSSEDGAVAAAQKLYLLSWLSTSDARTARGTGLASAATAKILGYDGVILPQLAGDNPPSTLGSTDKGLIANGTYTAWGYENLFHKNTANQGKVFNTLKTALNNATLIGSAGLTLGEMNVNRSTDGGTVSPGALP